MHFRLIGRVLRQDFLVRRPAFERNAGFAGVAKFRVLDQVPDSHRPESRRRPLVSQKRITSWIASRTAGLRQLRSGCSFRKA